MLNRFFNERPREVNAEVDADFDLDHDLDLAVEMAADELKVEIVKQNAVIMPPPTEEDPHAYSAKVKDVLEVQREITRKRIEIIKNEIAFVEEDSAKVIAHKKVLLADAERVMEGISRNMSALTEPLSKKKAATTPISKVSSDVESE